MAPALGALPYGMVSPKLHQPGLWRGPGNTTASSPGTGDTFLLSLSGLALVTLPVSVSSVVPVVEEHPWHLWDVPPPLADFTSGEVPAASPPSVPSLILEGIGRHQSPGGQRDRLPKAGNFLNSQQKQSRHYMCLREGPSSATHITPIGMAGKVYRALPQAMADQTLAADPFAVTYQKKVIISPLCKPLPLFCMLTGFSEMVNGWHFPQEEKRLSCLICIACSVLFP